MTVYHVETKEAYDELMIELDEKGFKWRGGEKLTDFDEFSTHGKDTYVYEECCEISVSSGDYFKKHHSDVPVIEYKAKGENMTQEKIKQELHENALDIAVAIGVFTRGALTVESDLQEAKQSAKKLIEKIDEYLETLKPKFKVGDYVTLDIPNNKKIAKIDRLNGDALHGLWYDTESKIIEHDFYFGNEISVRHSRPTEIAEYESALSFYNHGRVPFEVKEGDIIRDDEGNILKDDEVKILSTFPKNLKKDRFTSGRYTFLKTVEEVNEWIGVSDE